MESEAILIKTIKIDTHVNSIEFQARLLPPKGFDLSMFFPFF